MTLRTRMLAVATNAAVNFLFGALNVPVGSYAGSGLSQVAEFAFRTGGSLAVKMALRV